MALSYNLGYQESIPVHPTRCQNFAAKVYSNFPNIWEWLISDFKGSENALNDHSGDFFLALSVHHASRWRCAIIFQRLLNTHFFLSLWRSFLWRYNLGEVLKPDFFLSQPMILWKCNPSWSLILLQLHISQFIFQWLLNAPFFISLKIMSLRIQNGRRY